jgi:radical SAM protein with 4Fe4S-binding SPASM domain
VVVFTGGDPLKRADLLDLIRHARDAGLQTALTPSATPLATRQALQQARDAGVSCLGISLDGSDAATHDSFRGWQGSFERTLQMLAYARDLELPVQVNTTITRRNVHQVDAMAELFADQQIMMWSVFFLVPVGRGELEERIAPEEYEDVFQKLWAQSQRQPYGIKTTEAPHYRRFVLQRGGDPLASSQQSRPRRAPLGVGDGKGVMFVSHVGEIYPAGFLPLKCGRFPDDSVVDTYQNHPTFLSLRDPEQLTGKCGVCEYRDVCGGSRSRAYAVFDDPLASEPDCVYSPVDSEAVT